MLQKRGVYEQGELDTLLPCPTSREVSWGNRALELYIDSDQSIMKTERRCLSFVLQSRKHKSCPERVGMQETANKVDCWSNS